MTNNKTKTILTVTLAAVVVSMVAGNSMAYADFSGDYDPANWTLTTNGGNGSVDTTGAPASIELTGDDSGAGVDTDYTVTITVVCDGTVDFDWAYSSNDLPGFDDANYLVNGAETFLSETNGGNGSESVTVTAGDTFGFRVNTIDGVAGPGILDVTNFDVSNIPCADIDIKPNSDPNSINLHNGGVIPVAILGSDIYDVSDVDVTTLVFEGADPKHDLTDPLTLAEHTQDVNDDGFLDLVAHFPTRDVTTLGESDSEGCLAWDDSNGANLECDSTRVFDAPNGDKPNP